MNADTKTLSANQHKILAALLKHPTILKAAEQCSLNESTIRRFLRDPNFKLAYLAARRETVDHVIAYLQSAGTLALDALIDVMRDDRASAIVLAPSELVLALLEPCSNTVCKASSWRS